MQRALLSAAFLVCLFCATVQAQFQFSSNNAKSNVDGIVVDGGPSVGEGRKQIWRAGISMEPRAPMQNITVTVPIPMDWPEQKVVSIREESLGPARLHYRTVSQGAREAVFEIDQMRMMPLELVLEVELINYDLIPPENTEDYIIPKRVPRDVELYLKPSPDIQSNERVFKKMFAEITENRETDWDKVEALYSFVQSRVRYEETLRDKRARGALAVVSDPEDKWFGDCKDMSALFVALCRAGHIPARLVRVPEHCYAEFYLELPADKRTTSAGRKKAPSDGFWFPCQVAGTYAFGGIPERRPILQKGDSFPDREADNKRREMFLRECFTGTKPDGSPLPKFRWINEVRDK